MNIDEVATAAAKVADIAVWDTLEAMKALEIYDEDDITPFLVGALTTRLRRQIGGLFWSAKVMRHRRGVAAEERTTGADLLIHVKLDTQDLKYSKGVLIQAKKCDYWEKLSPAEHVRLKNQCDDMLNITPSAFVLDYASNSIRCGSALRIAGDSRRDLMGQCSWTSYRFFWEFFRCLIGDQRIVSSSFAELPIPLVLSIRATDRDVPDLADRTG